MLTLLQQLQEDLGNLANLRVGKMINILKQIHRTSKKYGPEITPIKGNFKGKTHDEKYAAIENPDISETSKIVDVGVLKNGLASLRKAYKAHNEKAGFGPERVEAFALYVDGNAVAFAKCDEHALSHVSRDLVFAYDLSMFKEQRDKEHEEELEKASEWNKRHVTRKADTSFVKKEVDKYSYRYDPKRPVENFAGQSVSVAYLKKFFEDLTRYADGKPITCKLVLKDVEANAKRRERASSRPTEPYWNDLNNLQNRLARYKISKKPSVDNIEDFLKLVLNDKVKVIQFEGHGYSTKAESYDKLSPFQILNGQQFRIYYTSVDPGVARTRHKSINVIYKFDKQTETLKAFKVEWSNGEHPLDPEIYLRDVLKVNSITKEDILKAILTRMKSGSPNEYPKIRAIIHASRKAGYDYPEFSAIEKSMNAALAKKEP